MNKPLFKCEECKHSTSPIWEEPCYDCICRMGVHYEPIPRTNFDVIKKMDTKELSKWFAERAFCTVCPIKSYCLQHSTDIKCADIIYKYLTEEVSNENTIVQK